MAKTIVILILVTIVNSYIGVSSGEYCTKIRNKKKKDLYTKLFAVFGLLIVPITTGILLGFDFWGCVLCVFGYYAMCTVEYQTKFKKEKI
jgi:hypothetical protein